jgi:hypothetical protein
MQPNPLDEEQMKRDALMKQMGPNQPAVEPMPVVEPAPAPAGSWGPNYEWQAAAGGPKPSDLLGKVGDPSRLTGFNTGGWGSGERGTESSKNTFGMIASRVDPRSGGALDSIMGDADFKSFYPNAQKVGFDKIDFDGPGGDPPVDVLRNATQAGGGDAWAYQVDGGGGQAQMPGQDLAGMIASAQAPQSDPLAEIMAQIEALSQGEDDPMQRKALMDLLGQPQMEQI